MSTPRASLGPLLALCAAFAAAALQCSRQPELDEVFEPPRPAKPPKAAATQLAEFELVPGGVAELSLGRARQRVRGHVALTQGRLQLDLAQLASTRGQLSFDLTTLELEQEPKSGLTAFSSSSATLTEQSLWWLQVAPPKLLAKQPQFRYAHFSIQSAGGLSARSAHGGKVVEPAAGWAEARRVSLQVTGELELHGFRIPYTAPVVATFHWKSAAVSARVPDQLQIEIARAVPIDLIAHGVVPRDARGEVVTEALAELQKQARSARVTGNWLARPSRAGAGR